MTRNFKLVCNTNLIVAMLVVGGYIVYAHYAGLHIDQHFLGSGPVHTGRSGGARISPWAFSAFVECALLLAFIVCRWMESDMKGHRVFSGLIGAVGLYVLLVTSLVANTYPADEFVNRGVSRLDSGLALYVWGSHILYALFGGADA
jgi:hypothetical protein